MVCARKSATAIAAAATSVYQSYSPSATGTSGASSPAGFNGTNTLAASNTTRTAAATTVSAANTGIKGFNYAAFFLDYSAKVESDFEYEFQRAQELTGTTGWTSARLYTMGE